MPRAFLVKRLGNSKEHDEKDVSSGHITEDNQVYLEKRKVIPQEYCCQSDCLAYRDVKELAQTRYMGKYCARPYFGDFLVTSRGVLSEKCSREGELERYRLLEFKQGIALTKHLSSKPWAGLGVTHKNTSHDSDEDEGDSELEWQADYNNNNSTSTCSSSASSNSNENNNNNSESPLCIDEEEEEAKYLMKTAPNGFVRDHHHHDVESEKFGNKPQFQCNQCEKTFKTKYTLNIHRKMPSHTTLKPFVCPTCGKGFRLSSTLCRHKIIHTSQRPHRCHVCQKSFNRSSTLKTHLRTHSNVKEFTCNVCGKGFHQKGNLRNHVLIHTGEKPYECSVCKKSFNKLSNLKFHMHSHTDQKPYRCRYCKRSFSKRGELKQHIAHCKNDSNEG